MTDPSSESAGIDTAHTTAFLADAVFFLHLGVETACHLHQRVRCLSLRSGIQGARIADHKKTSPRAGQLHEGSPRHRAASVECWSLSYNVLLYREGIEQLSERMLRVLAPSVSRQSAVRTANSAAQPIQPHCQNSRWPVGPHRDPTGQSATVLRKCTT